MTDEQIIKALECCIQGDQCAYSCPYDDDESDCNKCTSALAKDALDLINRQKAEIERLKEDFDFNIKLNGLLQEQIDGIDEQIIELDEQIDKLNCALQTAKSEAIKEFAVRLKCGVPQETGVIRCADVDNLVKEMVGDDYA